MTTENMDGDRFFYCNDSITVEGPHTWKHLLELHGGGVISQETAICQSGSEEWISFGSFLPTGEQALVEEKQTDLAEEAPEPTDDPSPAPIIVSQKPSGLAPKRWATVAGAVLIVALLAYSGLRFLSPDKEKVPLADTPKPAEVESLSAFPQTHPQQSPTQTEQGDTSAQHKPGMNDQAGVQREKNQDSADSGAWDWVIRPRFDEAQPFASDGLALVRFADKWGMVDKSGKEVLPCRFEEIIHFAVENCAAIRLGDQWGLADGQGKVVLNPEWEAVGPLVRGFIPVKRDGKWGYVDASGKLVIQPTWDDAWRFSPAGTAVVTMGTGRDRKRGFIDQPGRTITSLEWDGAINHVAEGVGAVRRGDGWALIDKTGQLLCEPEWKMQWRLLRADLGFLPVWKRGRWGILGLDGQMIVPPEWEWMAPAKNGVLLAKAGAPAIFIGAGGETTFETGPWDEVRASRAGYYWNEVEGFSEGYLAVRSGDKWGFIDENGTTVIQPEWDNVGRLSEGLVAVQNNAQGESWKFLKLDGTPAFPSNMENLENLEFPWNIPRFRNGSVKAWSPKRDGRVLIDHEGKVTPLVEHQVEKKSWLPKDIMVKGTYIQHTSRYGRYGYMRNFVDSEGNVLMRDVPVEMTTLDDPFPYPGPPSYGLARADGEVLVEPAWDWAEFIAPGWVRVWVNDQAGLVNREGRAVLAYAQWDSIEITENSLVLATKDGALSVFDAEGEELLPKQFPDSEYVDFYGNGLVVKSRRPDGSTLWSLWEPAAGPPLNYENAERVYWTGDLAANGLLYIKERDTGQWSLIKRDGTPLGIRQAAKPHGWFIHEGFVVQRIDNHTAVHTTVAGQVLGQNSWENAYSFSNGLAAVKSGGKWGFIDTTGRMVIPAEWDQVGNFRNEGSVAAPVLITDVKRGGLWGCINREGKVIVEPCSDWPPQDRTQGLITFAIQQEGVRGRQRLHFNTDGTPLNEPPPTDRGTPLADPLAAGMLIKSSGRKFGLDDAEGHPVLEPVWDQMTWIGPGLVAAWNQTDGGIFNAKGQPVFRDDAAQRLARFDRSYSRYQQGLVLIEATPVWGYAMPRMDTAARKEKSPVTDPSKQTDSNEKPLTAGTPKI